MGDGYWGHYGYPPVIRIQDKNKNLKIVEQFETDISLKN